MSEQVPTNTLPLFAHARRQDPETSHAAAAVASERIRESQLEVLRAFAVRGAMCDVRLQDFLPATTQSPSGIRSRRAELVEAGLLRWSGRKQQIGRTRHMVWKITEAGSAYLRARP